MRVLIVDDDWLMRTLTDVLLNAAGVIHTLQATNGREALALLKREPADLIISEWSMPRLDGLGLLRSCKGEPALKDIPFIMSSTRGERNQILQAVEAGADAYLVKPFSLGDLHAVLREICGSTNESPLRQVLQIGARSRGFPTKGGEVLSV